MIFTLIFCLNSFKVKSQTVDTTALRVSQLTKLKVYYINQSRKTNVSESQRNAYKTKIDGVSKDLEAIENVKREDAQKKGAASVTKFKKDSAELHSEFEMAKLFTPELYPVEIGAWFVGAQVSLLKPFTYTTPFQVYVDKTISEKITAGFYIGHFTELDQYAKGFGDKDKKDWSYTVRSKNYNYSDIMFGVRGAYHLFSADKPLFNLNPLKWDIYVGAILGYNMAIKPEPFLLNRSFEIDTRKGGINYGVYPGIRYMADDRLGFNAEVGFGRTSYANIGVSYKIVKSDVVVEKTEKEDEKGKGKNAKGKSSGGKNSKGKGKGKSSKGKKKR